MSFFATLRSWMPPRRKLLAGLVGVAVEAASAAVPGVGLMTKVLGTILEKGTEAALDPQTNQPLSPQQLAQLETWGPKMCERAD